MPSKCPGPLIESFIRDVGILTPKQLAKSYKKSARTLRRWKKDLRERGLMNDGDWVPVEPGTGPTFRIKDNYAVAESIDGRIRTEADILNAARVDLSVWKVRDKDGLVIKAWEGYAADVDKDLEYLDGRATGHVKREGIITTTLWSVKVNLVRINPIPISPMIQPVEMPQFDLPTVDPCKSEGTAMIIADPHFGYEWEPPSWKLVPFHDRRVLDIFLQILEVVQPDVVELDGDLLDLTVWQDKFLRENKYFQTTQPALYECVFFLQGLVEASPRSKKRAHMGNHGLRMEKTLINHVRESCFLRAVDEVELPPALSVPKLLALHRLGIDWVGNYPDDISWLGEHIRVSHEQGRYHAVVGHIHRDELVSESRMMPDGSMKRITGYCPGCACHTDGRVPGSTSNSNWRQGVGIIEWSGSHMSVTHIPIQDGVAVWQGKRFEARDWVGPLKDAYPDWNW